MKSRFLKNRKSAALLIIFVLTLSFSIISWTFTTKAFSDSFYDRQFEKTGVYSLLGNIPADYEIKNMLEYLQGGELDSEGYSQSEQSHLYDVKVVFEKLFVCKYIFTILALISGSLLFYYFRPVFMLSILWSGILLILLLGVAAVLPFDMLFENFHKTFFNPGTYTFDASSSLMKSLLPDELFQNFVIEWSISIIAIGTVLIIISLAYFSIKKDWFKHFAARQQ